MIRKTLALTATLGALVVAHQVRADDDPNCNNQPSSTTTIVVPPPAAPTAQPSAQSTQAATPDSNEGNASYEEPDVYSYRWYEPRLASGVGVGLIVGGGVTGFTNSTMRDSTSSVGGLWDARVSIGTHVPIGLDLSYVGTATTFDALTGTGSATLLGTALEGALRWNILPHSPVDPYIFAGLGWQHYSLTNTTQTFNASSNIASNSDNYLSVPMGAGLSIRDVSGFMFDLRGTFRAMATTGNMVIDPRTGQTVDLHSWEASAALGYEF